MSRCAGRGCPVGDGAGLRRAAQSGAPMLDRVEHLPGHQRDALRTRPGSGWRPVPDRFLVRLAVLGLVAEVARKRRLICVPANAIAGGLREVQRLRRRRSSDAIGGQVRM